MLFIAAVAIIISNTATNDTAVAVAIATIFHTTKNALLHMLYGLMAVVASLAIDPPLFESAHPHMVDSSKLVVTLATGCSLLQSLLLLSQLFLMTLDNKLLVILVVYGGSKFGAK